jgi:hypothetical protein
MLDITFLEEGNRLMLLVPWESVLHDKMHSKADDKSPSVWISINRG